MIGYTNEEKIGKINFKCTDNVISKIKNNEPLLRKVIGIVIGDINLPVILHIFLNSDDNRLESVIINAFILELSSKDFDNHFFILVDTYGDSGIRVIKVDPNDSDHQQWFSEIGFLSRDSVINRILE